MKRLATMLEKVAVFIAAFLLATLWARAEALHIVGDDHAKPKNWLGVSGEAQGIHIELLEEISRRTGLDFTYELVPWKRAFVISQNGRGAIIGFSKTSERQKSWYYSDPLYFDELVFVGLKNKGIEFEGLSSLAGLTIGVKSGATYGDDFEEAKKTGLIKVVETPSRQGQLRMLVAGRVDLVLLSPGGIALETEIAENAWLRQHRDNFSVISPAYKLDPNYIGVPKSLDKEHLLPTINEAIDEIRADGTYEKIVTQVTNEVINELRRN